MYRDLIYKDDLIGSMRNQLRYDEFQWFANVVNEQPLVNAQPIIYGEWINVRQEGVCSWTGECSNCHDRNDIPPPIYARYCPNCGARMVFNG